MKKLIYIIVFALTSITFAQSLSCKNPAINSDIQPPCKENCCETLPKACCDTIPCNYCDNAANPCCDYLPPCVNCELTKNSPRRGVNFELIFAQPRQDGLDYVINNSISVGTKSHIAQPDFDWFIGAKGGVEYTFYYDRWNLKLNGMVINASAKDRQRQDVADQTDFSETINSIGLIPVWNHPASYGGNLRSVRYSYSDAKWKQDFYSINMMLGKKFSISKQISFLPSFGLCSVFVFDDFKVCYKDGNTFPLSEVETLHPLNSYSKNEQDTYGVGPRVGVDTRWYFCPNVNFFAEAYGSILYSFFYSKRHDINNFQIQGEPQSIDDIKMKHDFTSVKPALELILGLSYEHCIISKNKIPKFIRFSFGYGINYFWKQNQLIQFDDDVNDGNFYTIQGDLHMQEINIGVTCLF